MTYVTAHEKTKEEKCTQQRLMPAWVSKNSDQSLRNSGLASHRVLSKDSNSKVIARLNSVFGQFEDIVMHRFVWHFVQKCITS